MRSKIIVTVGPAVWSEGSLRGLVEAGARVFRLNFSHSGAAEFGPLVNIIRRLERETGMHLAVMQDLSGPKIRTCDTGRPPMEVTRGDELLLGLPRDLQSRDGGLSTICLDHPELLGVLETGDTVSLSDGGLRFEVLLREGDSGPVHIRAVSSGVIAPRKGITFPGKLSPLPALTDKDLADLRQGADLGLDAVAVSYVQGPDDIQRLKDELGRLGLRTPVVAKLERRSAVERLEEIIALADAIMVARGDLGLECPLPDLPGLQKRIVAACNRAARPVIVATQMLLSMVGSPVPTRAETTDVANAVLDGADCLMLSEETAVGKFPIETVDYMRRIAEAAENLARERHPEPLQPGGGNDPARFMAYAASLLSHKSHAKALVAHTTSGATARLLSACRPEAPILGLSPDHGVRRFLNFSWGVEPHPGPSDRMESASDHLERAERFVENSGLFGPGEAAVITAGQPKPGQERTATNVVKLYIK